MLACGCKTQIFSPGRVTGNIEYFYFGLVVHSVTTLPCGVEVGSFYHGFSTSDSSPQCDDCGLAEL